MKISETGDLVFEKNDLWDLDIVLSKIIHTALTQFVEQGTNIIPKEFKGFTLDCPSGTIDDDTAYAEWMKTLKTMISAFEPLVDYQDVVPFDKEKSEEFWNTHKEWLAKYDSERLNGRLLFAKHFHNLWD